ncbi:hypothetical protein EDC53_101578 [Phytobacter diazotrophicus]|nr:hypothetical protein EDC53_101578 [Phytobacter diazotrophicus]
MMKPAEIIATAMKATTEKQRKENEQRVTVALEAFTQARDAHTASMKKLYDTEAAIRRSEQERQAALDESAEAEQSWRSRFRSLRGNITPEMKAEHSQRVANRELAEEFTALIAELEDDKDSAMLGACRSARQYTDAHRTAFTTYADGEWACALTAIDPALIRAFVLRIRSLELSGNESAYATAARELANSLGTMKAVHEFDMAQEPVLSVTGLYRPALTGLDMKLYNSPARCTQLAQALAAKKAANGTGV